MKFVKAFFTSLFLLASLIITPTVFAGGGGVYANTSNTDDPHYNIVRVYFDPHLFTCKGMVVSVNFAEPKDGDRISGGNGDNSSTISSDASLETVNGKQILRCSTYVKVYSPTLEFNRTLNISFKGPNLEGSRQIAISPGYENGYNGSLLLPWEEGNNYPTSTPTPTAAPVSGINVWVLNQQSLGSNGRQATIKWSAFDGYPGTFTIYGKAASNKNNWDKLMEGERGPSATIKIMTNEDYYVKINGCQDKYGNCVDSNVILLSKMQQNGEVVPSLNPNPTISPTFSPSPSGDNTQVAELNQKMENLQNQLKESQQKQSALESRLNQVLSWIKSIFPFFR